jgi:hypothetical protein
MLKNSTSMKRDTSYTKFTAISCQVYPALLLGVSVGNCEKDVVVESGMIRTQVGTHNRSKILAVHGMPCAIPSCNNNSMMELPVCIGHLN